MAQQGYAVVDVDEEPSGSRGRGLEFQSFLDSDSSRANQSSSTPREAPFSLFNLAYYQTDSSLGPFWTLTTLILILYTTSTLTISIAQYLNSDPVSSSLPLLSTATSTVYLYGLLVPSLLWGATKWLGIGEWGIAEVLGVYGYSMGVFIPISLLCLIPVGIVRWVLIILGGISSGYFLVRNIYPVLASAENKFAQLLIGAVVALHGIMIIAMKVIFFSNSVVGPDPINDQLP
ncbi:hypothetical protein I350_04937 [Cryptococcus amylolentus CBS 6273]|uniref:Protein YIP n=1 Tax=Cryptococcus amylolentus CBS 6273 TaxID=1296118 RepID=A0A1E3JYM1_9TREE|nr:hypothetical protein I350_04937 [Cryptococcus amylolentus CBS 6273]